MAALNKDGQIIGRKGAESRARLLDVARDLLISVPVQKLTASAIARAAGLASQTFYLYFRDVDELLLQLCAQAAEDAQDVALALDAPWDTGGSLLGYAEGFVTAFYRYWDRHRPVLNVRNFLADHGHEAFEAMRNTASLPIVQKIAERIAVAHGDGSITPKDALARAIIIFAAIERMAARYSVIQSNGVIEGADLKRAEAHILSLLLTRVTVDP